MKSLEYNFDGIVGPTHNYAGLAFGNVAAAMHASMPSNPKAAVMQGLAQMRLLFDMGIPQAILPPHERPDVRTLKQLGFCGTDSDILSKAKKQSPEILASVYSASGMWTANAATVSPSVDSSDGKVHVTAANLVGNFHRSLETEFTKLVFKSILPDADHFRHHEPLPSCIQLSDEGAANHLRLSVGHAEPGIEVFVYGISHFDSASKKPVRFPARQSLEASTSIARLHRLRPDEVLFIRQNPDVIDRGVFHNDVISVANENVLLYHEESFEDRSIGGLKSVFRKKYGHEPVFIRVTGDRLSVDEAVRTYLFNSRLVTISDGTMALIAPQECCESSRAADLLEEILADRSNPIKTIRFTNIRESMQNGGGPACLRLRIILTDEEKASINQGVILNSGLFSLLEEWAGNFYRDHLHFSDFDDPQLLYESRQALDQLTRILGLGSIYSFQKQ